MNNSSLFTNVFKTLFGTQITPTSDQFVPITGSDATPAGISSMAGIQSVLGGLMHIKNGSIPKDTPTELVGASGVYIIGMYSGCTVFTVKYWTNGVHYLIDGGADQSFILTHEAASNIITIETSINNVEYIYIGF